MKSWQYLLTQQDVMPCTEVIASNHIAKECVEIVATKKNT
jgi:hypothetical protein